MISKSEAIDIMNLSRVHDGDVTMDEDDHDAVQEYIEHSVTWDVYKQLLDEAKELREIIDKNSQSKLREELARVRSKYADLRYKYDVLAKTEQVTRVYAVGYSDGYQAAISELA